jgi:hypothetical protein
MKSIKIAWVRKNTESGFAKLRRWEFNDLIKDE